MQTDEQLEQERLQQVQALLSSYSDLLENSFPSIQEACQQLVVTAGEVSVEGDLEYACNHHGTGPNQPEQLLLDCYVSSGCIHHVLGIHLSLTPSLPLSLPPSLPSFPPSLLSSPSSPPSLLPSLSTPPPLLPSPSSLRRKT